MSIESTVVDDGKKGTPGRIIKVNHAGEFGAINIYKAQLLVAQFVAPSLVARLEDFKAHEERHLSVFGGVLAERGIPRCKSYLLCGIGGWALGFLTALLGRVGIMACTAAVEQVVTEHLREQIRQLDRAGDARARDAVASILADEEAHLEAGLEGSRDHWLYRPVRTVVSASTEFVIWLGMKL